MCGVKSCIKTKKKINKTIKFDKEKKIKQIKSGWICRKRWGGGKMISTEMGKFGGEIFGKEGSNCVIKFKERKKKKQIIKKKRKSGS